MPELNLGSLEESTRRFRETKPQRDRMRADKDRLQEEAQTVRRRHRDERAAQHASELLAWIATVEFAAMKELLEAADRRVELGDHRSREGGMSVATFTSRGFILYIEGGSEAIIVNDAEGFKEVGYAFLYGWEEPDHHGKYPGGIIEFIRERVQRIMNEDD